MLQILCCPLCEDTGELKIEVTKIEKDEIISGKLICANCSASFKIESGIPCLLAGKESKSVQNAFSQQWKYRYSGKFEKESRIFWIENEVAVKYITDRMDLVFTDNEWILDAGCGSGEKVIMFAKLYPNIKVVAMDFSMTLAIMAEKAKDIPNLYIVQGDVMHPPFKRNTFSKIISIGVLHHTPDTYKSFKSVSRLVKEQGKLIIWIYPHYNESPFFNKFYYFFRDVIFLGKGHTLPADIRLSLLFLICLPVFLLMPFFLFSKILTKGFYNNISVSDLYKGLVFMLFDDISPEFQFRHKVSEIGEWYKEAGFKNFKNPELGFYVGEEA